MTKPATSSENPHSELVELQLLWKLLPETATTHTLRAYGHPSVLNERAPFRVGFIDDEHEVQNAATEIAHILGLFNSDVICVVLVEHISEMLSKFIDIAKSQGGSSSWVAKQSAITAILNPVLARLRYLLSETQPVSYCPECGQPIRVEGDSLICAGCGTRTLPRYVTCREAVEELGISYAALRKAIQRHHLVPLAGSWPSKFWFDEMAALVNH